jgi:hypothetical protein
MQAMGYRYNTQAERLLRLDRFLQGRPDLSGHPDRASMMWGRQSHEIRKQCAVFPVFHGIRMPVQTLFEYLEGFPNVSPRSRYWRP